MTRVQDFKDMSESDVKLTLELLGKHYVPECIALKNIGADVECESNGEYINYENNFSSIIQAPDIVTIVGLTSIDSDKITLEWIEANDDTTARQDMQYENTCF